MPWCARGHYTPQTFFDAEGCKDCVLEAEQAKRESRAFRFAITIYAIVIVLLTGAVAWIAFANE